jgi:hypothetical protein
VGAAGAQHEGAGAAQVGAGVQHVDCDPQQLFLQPQRASAVSEQRTSPIEQSTAAVANFNMISLLAMRRGLHGTKLLIPPTAAWDGWARRSPVPPESTASRHIDTTQKQNEAREVHVRCGKRCKNSTLF